MYLRNLQLNLIHVDDMADRVDECLLLVPLFTATRMGMRGDSSVRGQRRETTH